MRRPNRIRKLMLVFPSMVYIKTQSRKTAIPPLGLLHLAAWLQDSYEIRVVDSPLEGFDNEQEQPNGLHCYGLTDGDYQQRFEDFKPDVVGISCLFSTLHNQALRVARLAKQVDPNVKTVMGGPHPSALPALVLKDPAVDYCVLGEGEKPLQQLLEYLSRGEIPVDVDGVGYKSRGKIGVNAGHNVIEDLDQLPAPAWHQLDYERYFTIGSVQGLRLEENPQKPLRLMQIGTSRGCPYSCTYCGKNAVWGDRIRYMGPDRVLQIIEQCIEEYQVERLAFQDDNLTLNRRRALEIFRGLADKKWPVTWEAHNGLSFATLDEEMLNAMAQSGCVSFTGAVESGSPEVLQKLNKRVDLERVIQQTRYAQSIGIDVRAFYVMGFPGETREQIQATRDHMKRLNASVSAMALYTPIPASPLYQQLEADGVLDTRTLDFEKLAFGAFDKQLSEVTVSELHRIRKIDWLMNSFADADGNLKRNIQVRPEIVMEEFQKGLQLYPDAPEILKLQTQALSRFSSKFNSP